MVGVVAQAVIENAEVLHTVVQCLAQIVRLHSRVDTQRVVAVGQSVVERHILRIVTPQLSPSCLHFCQQLGLLILRLVAVVVVERGGSYVELAAGQVVEQPVLLAVKQSRLLYVVKQLIGAGNVAMALQRAGLQQLSQSLLHPTIGRRAVEHKHRIDIYIHRVVHGAVIIRHSDVVPRAQPPVGIARQTVVDVCKRTACIAFATVRIVIASLERRLVQRIDLRPQQCVDLRIAMAAAHDHHRQQQPDNKVSVAHNDKKRPDIIAESAFRRSLPDLNRSSRFCRPVPSPSAKRP